MSGSTIGGVVGAVVGWFVGGPQGAQWGWMIGSMAGGYLMPEQVEGPRLKDSTQTTGRDGIFIPFGYGRFPVSGNVIWRSELTEHEDTERQGKGGGPEVTNYTYTRSYAVGICEGEIIGLLIVKENGKIVYDTRPDEDLTAAGYSASQITEVRAGSAKWLQNIVIYRGDEDQLPDATMEAIEGAGNVSAHRGLAYIVATNRDLTDERGAIPQYEFVVVGAGDADQISTGFVWYGSQLNHAATSYALAIASDGTVMSVNHGGDVEYTRNGGRTWTDVGGLWLTPNQISCVEAGGTFYITTEGTDIWTASVATPGDLAFLINLPNASYFRPVFVWTPGGVAGICTESTIGTPARVCALGTWTITSCGIAATNGETFAGVCHDGDYFYFFTASGKVIRSATGTSGFTHISTTPAAISSEMAARPATVGGPSCLLVNCSGTFYRSYDQGATWESAGLASSLTSLTYQGGAFFTCAYGDVYGSVDDGESFQLAFEHPIGGAFVGIIVSRVGVIAYNSGYSIGIYAAPGTGTAMPDIPEWVVTEDGTLYPSSGLTQIVTPDPVSLSTIVSDLFDRSGLTSSQYDVSALTDQVVGFRVANESGSDVILAPLMAAFAFDVAEFDGKVRCVKRGGASSFALTSSDLVRGEGDPFTIKRIQEPELLRKTTVNYIDPAATYTVTTQSYERRSGIVRALGEASAEVPIVCVAETAARIAERQVKIAWSEPEKYEFVLATDSTAITPTDVGTYTDDDGEVFALRIMRRQDEAGRLMIEAAQNDQLAYTSLVSTGTAPVAPTPSLPGLSGPTTLAVMNLPVLAETDDEVGVYLAAGGSFSGWAGCTVQTSVDDGVSWQSAATFTQGSGVGVTTTALAAWTSSEYPSTQSVTVTLPYAPSTISYEALLRYGNRYALQLDDDTWEVGQFQTVADNGGGSYTLSGLVRGKYATTPGAAAIGARFVLIDNRVQFLRAERSLIGDTILVRAVTAGTSGDDNASQSFDFSECVSQTEWTPHGLEVERDGSDNVTATWIGRARLGTDVGPFHSQYFSGYRVTYDDGVTPVSFDTTDTTYTYNVAATVTVSVAALNEITGASASTAGISV